MPKNLGVHFPPAKQGRSQQTLDNLMTTAIAIVEEAAPDSFNSRTLSKKSGYALGTLHKRLGAIERVFIWAIQEGQKKQVGKVAHLVRELGEKTTLQDFAKKIIDKVFESIMEVSPKVMQFFENTVIRKNGIPPNYFDYLDVLINPYLEFVQKNKTCTFRIVSEREFKLIIRSMMTIVERPFIDGEAFAGTPEHRTLATEFFERLLGSNASNHPTP